MQRSRGELIDRTKDAMWFWDATWFWRSETGRFGGYTARLDTITVYRCQE
jgi:hypothetical protein